MVQVVANLARTLSVIGPQTAKGLSQAVSAILKRLESICAIKNSFHLRSNRTPKILHLNVTESKKKISGDSTIHTFELKAQEPVKLTSSEIDALTTDMFDQIVTSLAPQLDKLDGFELTFSLEVSAGSSGVTTLNAGLTFTRKAS